MQDAFFSFFLTVIAVAGNAEPLSWDELKSGNFEPIRDADGARIYAEHVDKLKSKGLSPETVVLEDVFNFTEANARQQSPQYKLVLNSFPYWVDTGMHHLLLFCSHPKWDEALLKAKSQMLMQEQFGGLMSRPGFEYIIYINPPGKQTVKGLAHAHIFVRNIIEPLTIDKIRALIAYSRPGVYPPAGT